MEHTAKPRILIFDLDGTLAESKQPVMQDMGLSLEKLLAHMPVAVMTGAGLPQLEQQFLPSMPATANLSNLYLFPDNAAQCFVYKDNAWQSQYDLAFAPEERIKVMR